jgi:hypothetical protein
MINPTPGSAELREAHDWLLSFVNERAYTVSRFRHSKCGKRPEFLASPPGHYPQFGDEQNIHIN